MEGSEIMTFQRGCSSDIKIPTAENENNNDLYDTASQFFKKITVMLHQGLFYRTYVYDNTIFDNDFSRILSLYRFTPPKV